MQLWVSSCTCVHCSSHGGVERTGKVDRPVVIGNCISVLCTNNGTDVKRHLITEYRGVEQSICNAFSVDSIVQPGVMMCSALYSPVRCVADVDDCCRS